MVCRTGANEVQNTTSPLAGTPTLIGASANHYACHGDEDMALVAKSALKAFVEKHNLIIDEDLFDRHLLSPTDEEKSEFISIAALNAASILMTGEKEISLKGAHARAFYHACKPLLTQMGWFYPVGSKVLLRLNNPENDMVSNDIYEVTAGETKYDHPRLSMLMGKVECLIPIAGSEDGEFHVEIDPKNGRNPGMLAVADRVKRPATNGEPNLTSLDMEVVEESETRLLFSLMKDGQPSCAIFKNNGIKTKYRNND